MTIQRLASLIAFTTALAAPLLSQAQFDRGDFNRGRRPPPPSRPFPPRQPERPWTPPPHENARLVDVHRFYSGIGHLLTLDAQEGYRVGFHYEGVQFRLFAQGGRDLQPLFRCYTGRTHFASLAANCEGQRTEGMLGYVQSQPSWNARQELVRCYNGSSHLITVSRQECAAARYWIEGVLGFVP